MNDLQLINLGMRVPHLVIDRTCFVKQKNEREHLKSMKQTVKSKILNAGFDPKKRMNLSEPIVAHIVF